MGALQPSGEPLMILSGDKGRGRLDLHITGGQPRIDLFATRPRDANWNPRVSLLAAPDGLSTLMFLNKDSVRTAIGEGKDGKPFLHWPDRIERNR